MFGKRNDSLIDCVSDCNDDCSGLACLCGLQFVDGQGTEKKLLNLLIVKLKKIS